MLEEDSLLQRIVRGIVQIVVVIALARLCVYSFGTVGTMPGQSMRPALEDGDRVLLDRLSLRLKGPGRCDIVLFTSPVTGNINMKRVMGLPGETVQIREGQLLINGEPLDGEAGDLYGKASIAGLAERPVLLGENEYFVLGDNREVSEDSRFETVGNVPLKNMTGRVWFRTAPFEQIGLVR